MCLCDVVLRVAAPEQERLPTRGRLCFSSSRLAVSGEAVCGGAVSNAS